MKKVLGYSCIVILLLAIAFTIFYVVYIEKGVAMGILAIALTYGVTALIVGVISLAKWILSDGAGDKK